MNLKFGVIYAKRGQLTDDEFFSNESGSPEFENFLNLLGGKISLKGWDRYRGGLDVHNNMTGTESVFTLFEDHQIMFHVSQLLPFSSEDTQQVCKEIDLTKFYKGRRKIVDFLIIAKFLVCALFFTHPLQGQWGS